MAATDKHGRRPMVTLVTRDRGDNGGPYQNCACESSMRKFPC